MAVAFHRHDFGEDEIAAVLRVLRSDWVNTGPETAAFEAELSAFLGGLPVIALNSATAALHLALRAAGIGPGDDVVVPAYTYSASAAAVIHAGARPVLADVGEDFCLGVAELERVITPRTRAVMPVDLGGLPADAPAIRAFLTSRKWDDLGKGLAARLGRPLVIVDAAHSLGARIGATPVGAIADATAFSFHAVKNITTGDGGALSFRTGDASLDAEWLRAVRLWSLHGQDKSALEKMKPGAWKYDIAVPGYKFNLTDVAAALGRVQLARLAEMNRVKERIRKTYEDVLAKVGEARAILRPLERGTRVSAPHLAMVNLTGRTEAERDGVIAHLASLGLATNVHYRPLPLLSAWRERGWRPEDFPVSMRLYENEISLPWHAKMTTADAEEVATELGNALD